MSLRTYFPCCVLLVSLWACSGAAAQAPLDVKLSDARRMAYPLFGFNTPFAMAKYTGGRYTHHVFSELARNFSCGAIRFPGGTVANFFDWKKGRMSTEFVRKVGKDEMRSFVSRDLKRNRGKLTQLDVHDFLRSAKQIGARPFVVLNVLMYSTAELKAIVDDVKNIYSGPIYWELGNEVSQEEYTDDYPVPGGWNATEYVSRVQGVIDHINERYPEDEVGVVVSQMVEGRHPRAAILRHVENRRKRWDSTVATLREYDAVIIHPYILSFSGNNAISESAMYEPSPKWRWVFSSVQNVPKRFMVRLENRFGNKKVWLTETGLIDKGVSAMPGPKAQPIYRALFQVANFIAWSRFFPQVDVYLSHGLFKGNGQHAVVYPDGSLTANGVGLLAIAWLMSDVDSLYPADVSGQMPYSGVGEYTGIGVYPLMALASRSSSGERRLLIVNVGGKNEMVRLPWVGARHASVAWKKNQMIRPGDFRKEDMLGWRNLGGREVTIPPYSITMIVAI